MIFYLSNLCIVLLVVIGIEEVFNAIISNEVQSQDVIINQLNADSNNYTTKQFGNIILSCEMIADQHLYILIDEDFVEDNMDFNEDSNFSRKTLSGDKLFEVVTYRPSTTPPPPTTEFITRTRNPPPHRRNNFNYRTTTETTTSAVPWLYDRHTVGYSWTDYYTTSPTVYNEMDSDEYRKLAPYRDVLAWSLNKNSNPTNHNFYKTVSEQMNFFNKLLNTTNFNLS